MTDQEIIDIWEAVRKQERFKSPFWEQVANETIVVLLNFMQNGGKKINLEHLALKIAKQRRHRIGEREARYIPVVQDAQGDYVWQNLNFDSLPSPASNFTPEMRGIASEVLDSIVPGWKEEGLKEIAEAPEGEELNKVTEKYRLRVRRFLKRVRR